MKFYDILGWLGAILLLLAFALKLLNLPDFIYLTLNLTGSLFLSYSSYKKKDFQPALLNIVWFLIALIGILALIFK